MFRVIRVLLLLAILAGTFLLFDKNSESITIYFLEITVMIFLDILRLLALL